MSPAIRMVNVVANARIHVGLADTGFASLRAYGGIGFSLGIPTTLVEIAESDRLLLEGFDQLDPPTAHDLDRLAHEIVSLPGAKPFSARLKKAPSQHVGFGSKTSLLLSVVAGADAVLNLKLSHSIMQRLTGRGRASGIGIHSFFCGGILWDGGHAIEHVRRLTPSSAAEDRAPPPLMLRLPFPDEWQVGLILPIGTAAAGQDEKAFFDRYLPITKTSALSAMATLYHGVLPAFVVRDLDALTAALATLHESGFKAIEVDAHGSIPRAILRALHEQRLCAGMSSMGPLIYVIMSATDKNAHLTAQQICEHYRADWLGLTRGCNTGALIREQVP